MHLTQAPTSFPNAVSLPLAPKALYGSCAHFPVLLKDNSLHLTKQSLFTVWGGILKRPIWLSCGNATILPSAQIPPTSLWASLAVNDTLPPISYLHQHQLLLTTSSMSISLCSQPCPHCMGYSPGTFYPLVPQLHPSTLLKRQLATARLVSPWAHLFDGYEHKFCIQVD